jgi:hypothetical protein
LIENSFNDRHDMRKSEFYDSIEYVVFFRDDVRNDFDDCLIDLVLDDLEKIDVFRVCYFFDDVVEINCDKREKKEINQTLSFCFFNENHDVVWTTKKWNNEFERRWTILCSFNEFSRLLSIFDDAEHDVSMSDSKNLSNNSFFDDSRFSLNLKNLFCVSLSDELVLKRSSNLICSSSCQIACFVEFENDASRCFEFWCKCVYNFCYCWTNELDISVYLIFVERLRNWLIEKQIIENAFKFFHVQTISIKSLERCRFIYENVQNDFDEIMIRIMIQIRTCFAD